MYQPIDDPASAPSRLPLGMKERCLLSQTVRNLLPNPGDRKPMVVFSSVIGLSKPSAIRYVNPSKAKSRESGFRPKRVAEVFFLRRPILTPDGIRRPT